MLSMSAASETKGNSFVPPDDRFQITFVASLEDLRNSRIAKTTSASIVDSMSFRYFIRAKP